MIDDRSALTRPPAGLSLPAASRPGFRRPAVALAAAVLCGALAAPPSARALTLSGVAVQSALGEPLRARIAVTAIDDAEAASLQARPASAAAFRAAGFGAPPAALSDLRIRLERPSDGPAFLQVEGTRPVRDPSLPLLLDLRWQGGSLTRGYTLQVDAPGARAPEAGAAAVAPQLGGAPQGRASAAGPGAAGDGSIVVRRGDTASRIAAARRPADVSLDQMLIALLQANPRAFVGGNVNRMRAGAVLQMPDGAQIRAVDPTEARRQIVAQSSDFDEFRRRLAGRAAPLARAASDRSARDGVAARLEDGRAAASPPDRLTLSRGANEERLAREKQSRADAARQAELQRNIGDLQRLGNAAAPTPAPAPVAAPPAAPAPPAPPPAPEPASAPSPATEPAPPPAAPEPAPSPAATPAPPPAAPPAAAPAEESGGVLRPVLWGTGAVLVLFAGLLAYRLAQRRRARAQEDQAFQESRDERDSFFDPVVAEAAPSPADEAAPADAAAIAAGATGADGDVDPIAEADVYLAYGREQQAEDILREAIRQRPERTAVHVRLLEMLAQRDDLPGFEAVARDAHAATGGAGPDWDRAAALGREIDPANPLYHDAPAPQAAAPGADPAWAAAQAGAMAAGAAAAEADRSADDDTAAFAPTLGPDALEAYPSEPRDPRAGPGLGEAVGDSHGDAFPDDGAAPAPASPPPPSPAPADAEAPADFGLDFNLDPAAGRDDPPAATDDPGFDFGPDAAAPPDGGREAGAPGAALPEDTLATKLDLAQEFEAIGDADGARTLIEEVIESSSGELRERARRMLADLG